MKINDNGTWKGPNFLYVKNGTEWTEPRSNYIKVNDTWRELVPINAIIFYTDVSQFADGKATLANGDYGTLNIIDKYVMGKSAYGTMGGGTTHNHQGYYSGTLTTSSEYGTSLNQGYTAGLKTVTHITGATNNTHTHTIASHYHVNVVSNIPSTYSLIPTMFGDKIYTGAIIPATSQLSGTIAYVASVIDYYIKLYGTSGTSTANLTHNHGDADYSPSSGYGGPSTASQTYQWENNDVYTLAHSHDTGHTDADTTPVPSYFNIIPNQVQSDIFFDELPAGSILAFTSAILPYGWKRLSEADDRLLKTAATYGGTGGSSTHTHIGSKNTGGWIYRNTSYNAYEKAGTTYYTVVFHQHSWTDIHSRPINHLPPYCSFVLARKLAIPSAPGVSTITLGDCQFSLSWTAVSDTDYYEIWYSETNDTGTATKWGNDLSGTTGTITGLSNNTTYYVWIKAKNEIGTSGFGTVANATALAIPDSPGASTITAGSSQLGLSWTAVSGATYYEVWKSTSNDSATATKYGADISGLTATITGLTNGTVYYVWLKAKNGAGTSGFGSVATGTPVASDIAAGTRTETSLCSSMAAFITAGTVRSCSSFTLDCTTNTSYKFRNITAVGRSSESSNISGTGLSVSYSFTGQYSTNGGGTWTNCTASTAYRSFQNGDAIHATLNSPYRYTNTDITFT